ncbi:MAG TPA: heimdallarchaeosortase [candidate division Zixibacteria bacterium]|nr:heimdallarchaeosortase [candidate division Zixibacteria bacterium]
MSLASWYPSNPRSRMNFFLRSFPMFIVLIVFLYFGLDWLGAFEFLEILVRNNSSWLMKVIFGFTNDEFTLGFYERIDEDILTGGVVRFGQEFPGMILHGYPKTLLIIRACTGMEAGALLMALILITPAKWYNKVIAQITNLLMMHIGNTFRIAFHFWFTRYLYTVKGLDADTAFYYAHDLLSKVFGFIGIVIFVLVIERTGVKVVSTFGAWMDAVGEGIKRLTWRIQGKAFYELKNVSNQIGNSSEVLIDNQVVEGEVETSNVEKIYFYPKEEIENDKWQFFLKSFGIFALVSAILLSIGLIPGFNRLIANASDGVATNWFGAKRDDFYSLNYFWTYSTFQYTDNVMFIVNMATNGMGLAAFMVGLVIATPGDKIKKIWASVITIVTVFPLHIFSFGFQKWATWSLSNNDAFRLDHPLLYVNMSNIVVNLLPIVFWLIGFILLLYIFKKLEIKAFTLIWIWLHQLYFFFLKLVGIRKKPKTDDVFGDDAGVVTVEQH